MLPPAATRTLEQFSASVASLVALLVGCTLVALLLAHLVGGRSRQGRSAVFGAVMLVGLGLVVSLYLAARHT